MAKNGVDLAVCTREADAKGVEYVWAVRKQIGRHAAEVLTTQALKHTAIFARMYLHTCHSPHEGTVIFLQQLLLYVIE